MSQQDFPLIDLPMVVILSTEEGIREEQLRDLSERYGVNELAFSEGKEGKYHLVLQGIEYVEWHRKIGKPDDYETLSIV